MSEFLNNAETARIAMTIAEALSRQAWAVTPTQRAQQPLLQVSKRDISLLVKCVDTGIQKFIGVSSTLDRLEGFTREYRARSGEGVVYVISRPLAGLDVGTLPSRGIALFMLDEIAALTAVESVYDKNFATLDDRTKSVVRGCKDLCVALSKDAANQGDFDEAQRWLELNLDGVHVIIDARYKLVDVLVRKGDIDTAKRVAQKGLEKSPYNHILLVKLRALEEKTGNTAALPGLDQRIATASQMRPSLESILANQNNAGGNSERMAQAPPNCKKVGLLRRLSFRLSGLGS